jgi:hypothetical protein
MLRQVPTRRAHPAPRLGTIHREIAIFIHFTHILPTFRTQILLDITPATLYYPSRTSN